MKLGLNFILIFTLFSCNENSSENLIGDTVELNENNQTINTGDSILNTEISEFVELETFSNYTKELDLFWVRDLEESINKRVGFVSVSDIYSLSDHPDSLLISENENKDSQYFKLSSIQRKRLLARTSISETDSLYIYDYSTDALCTFLIKDLNAVANLNMYSDERDCPCDQNEYMIGFEISKKYLSGLSKYYSDALVFIGEENPFARGQMKAIVWKKINSDKFPADKSSFTNEQKDFEQKNKKAEQFYLFESGKYQIFIQDFAVAYESIDINYRHLMVIDRNKDSLVNEIVFTDSEGSSVAPLNFGIDNEIYPDLKEQYFGKLFKNKPEVLFGFNWVSFGCPSIYFVNSKDKYVSINCDNRH